MFTVGIDLGTTASVISWVKNGKPEVVKIDGKITIPSVVNYSGLSPVIGVAAEKKFDSLNTIFSVKRHMGSDKKFLGHDATEVSAEILNYLKNGVEKSLKKTIDAAVITVPAHFSDIQRTETKRAASLAGIKVLQLINEPTAAAIAFGIDKKKEGIFLVYDFGGGTFDCSLLRLEGGIFQVLATGGSNYLGGDDIDNAILDNNLRRNKLDNIHYEERMQGKFIAKFLKENICNEEEIKAEFDLNDKKYTFSLTQKELSFFVQNLLQKTFDISTQVMDDASVNQSEIDGVILVGGMTKLTLIKTAVSDFFKTKIYSNLNPEEVVSLGAAIQAQSIVEKNKNMLLIDVVPLSLGIETFGGGVDKIIYRNTPIPISENREYTTYQDNQTGMKFRIVQGERLLANECQTLATFELKEIPPMPAGMARIVVEFSVDVNGILNVKAFEKTTGISQNIVVTSSLLSAEDMQNILEDAYREKMNDEIKLRHIEVKLETERLLNFWKSTIQAMPAKNQNVISEKIDSLENYLKCENYDEVLNIRKEIESIFKPFLDNIINRNLSGKRISDIRRK